MNGGRDHSGDNQGGQAGCGGDVGGGGGGGGARIRSSCPDKRLHNPYWQADQHHSGNTQQQQQQKRGLLSPAAVAPSSALAPLLPPSGTVFPLPSLSSVMSMHRAHFFVWLQGRVVGLDNAGHAVRTPPTLASVALAKPPEHTAHLFRTNQPATTPTSPCVAAGTSAAAAACCCRRYCRVS